MGGVYLAGLSGTCGIYCASLHKSRDFLLINFSLVLRRGSIQKTMQLETLPTEQRERMVCVSPSKQVKQNSLPREGLSE